MISAALFFLCELFARSKAHRVAPSPTIHPTFYRDVLPIFQQHCQTCHRAEGISSTPLETYDQVSRHAAEVVRVLPSARTMPPWFADPHVGHFANDPSLSSQEISTLRAWLQSAGKLKGNPSDSPPTKHWSGGWNIPQPRRHHKQKCPRPINIPASGDVEYTYEIVPTGFTEDKWVQASQILPSGPGQFVHHAEVVYIRPPDSKWLREAPVGVPFTAGSLA